MAIMPASGTRGFLAAGAVLFALETALGAAAAPRISMQHGPIGIDAESSTINYGTHEATLVKAVISQGDLRVTADHAMGFDIDSDNGRWVLTGNVHITSEKLGVLTSESATIDFRNNQLESAVVKGHPAEFEQTTSKTGVLARGHADVIQYTVATDIVRLTGNARLQYGETTTTAAVVVYNIRDRKLQFAGGGAPGSRVHILTTPQKLPKAGTSPKSLTRSQHAESHSSSRPP